jgi:hypothetical protein
MKRRFAAATLGALALVTLAAVFGAIGSSPTRKTRNPATAPNTVPFTVRTASTGQSTSYTIVWSTSSSATGGTRVTSTSPSTTQILLDTIP